jgi:hypothetical protein
VTLSIPKGERNGEYKACLSAATIYIYLTGIKPFEASDSIFPEPGIYAISAHYLDMVEWSRSVAPAGKGGESIFIYDLRQLKQETADKD